MTTRRWPAGLLLAALAGCGTTVPLSQQGQQSTDGLTQTTALPAQSQGPQGTTGLTTSGTAGSGAGTSATSGTSGGTGPGATSGSSSGAGTAGGGSATATGGDGRAAGSLKVGVLYTAGADQAAQALGINGVATGDPVAQATAVASYLNAHGGINGRKVTIVGYGLSTADTANNPAQAQQTACTSFTQDSHVAAVVSYLNLQSTFARCMHKAGVPVIDDAAGLAESTVAGLAGTVFSPGGFLPGRLYRNVVESLVASGFLTKSSKVGIYSYDDADDTQTINSYVKPALAAAGITSVIVEQTSNDASGIATNSAIVTQFAARGVDKVIPVSASPLFLMQAAESQGYRPKYGLNSSFGPGALFETAAPSGQLAGSQGLGFEPYSDIGSGNRGGPVSSNETLCFTIMKGAGQASSSGTTKLLQLQLCDTLLFLRDAAAKAGGTSGAQLAAGAAQLGSSWPAASTFSAAFPQGRPDGVSSYRLFVYQGSCSCYQYQGGKHPTS